MRQAIASRLEAQSKVGLRGGGFLKEHVLREGLRKATCVYRKAT